MKNTLILLIVMALAVAVSLPLPGYFGDWGFVIAFANGYLLGGAAIKCMEML